MLRVLVLYIHEYLEIMYDKVLTMHSKRLLKAIDIDVLALLRGLGLLLVLLVCNSHLDLQYNVLVCENMSIPNLQ